MKGKKILILSPQNWGKMFISKHHYAIEFAEQGNEVYYLNPPTDFNWNFSSKIEIENSDLDNLKIVSHKLFFPYFLKFKAVSIFHFFIRFQIKYILRKLGKFDLIVSFDLGNLYPLIYFKENDLKVFFPVDEPLNSQAILAANGASHIISITKEILEKYQTHNVPKLLLNHGVAEYFFRKEISYKKSEKLRVGLSGNFFRPDLDRITLLKIIKINSTIQFDFFGAYLINQSNVSGNSDEETLSFLNELINIPNVKMHGPLKSLELSKMLHEMDAFLICYDINKDQSKGTNYHKIMEYLATGKAIISNNVSAYHNTNLVEMPISRDSNNELPSLFQKVITNLEDYNSEIRMTQRIEFAKSNLYSEIIKSKFWPFINL